MAQSQNELAQASYRHRRAASSTLIALTRRLIPFWTRRRLRAAYLLPVDVIDTLTHRRKELVPPRYLNFVGDGDYEKTGEEFLSYFIELGGLQPQARVLEIGCGIGRTARALASFLTTGTYEGLDIVPKGIRWCQRNFTPRHPNFRFQVADVYNKQYNPRGRYCAVEYQFPFADNEFDFVYLASVFTHMLPPDMKSYLREIARVLRPGGKLLVTFFLLNSESRRLQSNGLSSLEFTDKVGEAWTTDKVTPETAIAFGEDAIESLYQDFGFRVEAVKYGAWCGRKNYLSYQDIVVAVKK